METNRDDFVIAIRSVFLKKENQQQFSLLALIIFSIMFITLGSLNFKIVNYIKIGLKDIVYRSSFIVSVPENLSKKTYNIVKNHFDLYKEFNANELALNDLRSKDLLNEFVILENERLKNIVDDYLVTSKEIVAKIIIDKQSPFLRSFILNKGSNDNIKLGMIVLDGDYLVGKVVEVNYLTSRILLLSDLNSKIPVIINPNGIQSILSGTGGNNGEIQYLKKTYNIEEGNTVYTSGAGSLFKAGIPVGAIKNLRITDTIDETILDVNKEVVFFSDFTQLNFVKVVSFKKEKSND
tara:strand:- start:229 stop:1110 length:882 start_codon:yes stop_codon:yes gene_type:complete